MEYVIALLGLTLLVIFHEFGHFIGARLFGVRVEEFMVGLPGPKLARIRIGETLYGITLIPFGGYVKLHGDIDAAEAGKPFENPDRAFLLKPFWQRTAIIFLGPFFNLVLAVFLFAAMFMYGVPGYPTTTVEKVLEGTAAARAGIAPNDRVLSIDGRKIDEWQELVDYVRARPGSTVRVVVERNGQRRTFKMLVGIRNGVGFLGLQARTGVKRLGFLDALVQGFRSTFAMTSMFVVLLGKLISSGDLISQSAGPVGIVVESTRAIRLGVDFYLYLLALLSINLAIVNLIPMPPLDGGRIALMVVERVTGKRIGLQVYAVLQLIGLLLFVILMIFLIQADVARYHPFGIGM